MHRIAKDKAAKLKQVHNPAAELGTFKARFTITGPWKQLGSVSMPGDGVHS